MPLPFVTASLYARPIVTAFAYFPRASSGFLCESASGFQVVALAAGSVVEFIEEKYLPWAEGVLRLATYKGYTQMFENVLKKHFGKTKLNAYAPHMATKFLTEYSKTHGRFSTSHLRAVMSAIFAYAVAIGAVNANPIRDAKLLAKPRATKPTEHYSIEEMKAILAALDNDKDAQDHAIFSLCFLGVQKAEIAALRWDDIDWLNARLHIERTAWKGHLNDGAKNARRVRWVELGDIAMRSLKRYKSLNASQSGFLFENAVGNPMDLGLHAERVLRPKFKALGLVWRAYYAGRRAAVTELRRHASPETVAFMLGHTVGVADRSYDKGRDDQKREATKAFDAMLAPIADRLCSFPGISGHEARS